MYRVLIAEDEPFINEGIGRMIEAFAPQYTVCACVYDGEEAIERLQKEEFDVVFTDIRMPGVDGIRLLEYIYKNMPQTLTVVISGYDIFDYAQKALKYHVFEYLLKPVSIGDMKELLDKLTEQLEKRREIRAEKYFHKIFSGKNVGENSWEEEKRGYRMFLLNNGTYRNEERDTSEEEERMLHTERQLHGYLSGDGIEQWFFFRRHPSSEFVIIEEFPETGNGTGSLKIRPMYEEMERTGIPVTVLEGVRLAGINSLYGEYRKLHRILKEQLRYGNSSYILTERGGGKPLPASGRILYDGEMLKNLPLYAKAGNAKYLEREIGRMLDYCNMRHAAQSELENCLLRIFCIIADETGEEGRFSRQTVEKEIRSCICMSDTYEQLRPMLSDVVYAMTGTHKEEEADRLADQVRDWLDNNFSNKITTKELSRQFGLVPSYLSMLFRQSQGISPSDYLTKIRIAKAKELLIKEKEMTVKEVAELVGFADQLYFSKVFKRETLMTPSRFRAVPDA